MPKAKKKTKGSATNTVATNSVDPNDMDFWSLVKIKDYLRRRGGRLTGNRKELLELAKCYAIEKPGEDPAIIAL